MEAAVRESRIEFSGFLNENSNLDVIKAAIQNAAVVAGKVPGGRVLLDFSKVTKANSCGILSYLRVLIELNVPVSYVNAPIWLVEQFNALDDFFVGDIIISSIYAQFYSPNTDKSFVLLQEIGKDIPILPDYSSFEIEAKSPEGHDLEPDYEPEIYYFFIAKRHEKFLAEAK
jgi:hypothetical protein